MALLGTFIDVTRGQSIGAGSWAAGTYVTVQHSLATTPDWVLPICLSIGASSASPGIGAVKGNASVSTLAFFGPIVNQASQPAVAVDVISVYAFSATR